MDQPSRVRGDVQLKSFVDTLASSMRFDILLCILCICRVIFVFLDKIGFYRAGEVIVKS